MPSGRASSGRHQVSVRYDERMRLERIAALLLAMALSSALADGGSNGELWVAVDGDDASDGTTMATAFRTIDRALRAATPGTTVLVLPGTYAESVRIVVRGEPNLPIVLRGEGGVPRLDGGREARWGLYLEDSRHVVVEDLELADYTDIGMVVVFSRDITLRRLTVHHNGFAPQAGWVEGYGVHLDESSELLVERNEVFANGPMPREPTRVGTGINGYAMQDAVIRNNRIHDNRGGGILVEDSHGVLVKGNRIYRNDLDVSVDQWWDGGIWLDGGSDVRLVRNRLWDNLGPGIEISDEDCQQPYGYVLKNNVSTGNYFGIFVWNFGARELPDPGTMRMMGNEISDNSRRDIWIQSWRQRCDVSTDLR